MYQSNYQMVRPRLSQFLVKCTLLFIAVSTLLIHWITLLFPTYFWHSFFLRAIFGIVFICILVELISSIRKDKYLHRRELKVVLIWFFVYLIPFSFVLGLVNSVNIIFIELEPRVLVTAYFQNFAFAIFCCIHPFFMNKACSQSLSISTEEYELNCCHLYVYPNIRDIFFDYCRSEKVYTEIHNMFRGVVGFLQFNEECYMYCGKYDDKEVTIIKNFLPKVCQGLYPLTKDETHEANEGMPLIALKYLMLFEQKILKIPDWCKSKVRVLDFQALFKLRTTLQMNWNMRDETFFTEYMAEFFKLLVPAVRLSVERIHEVLNEFRYSVSGQQVIYRLSSCPHAQKFQFNDLEIIQLRRDVSNICELEKIEMMVSELKEKALFKSFHIKKIHREHAEITGRRKRKLNLINS